MKDLKMSSVLIRLRHEKGVTQEELARYLGVTKAAVSKWETEQSYPDITLLPVLASYFCVSTDELLAYEPQMTREDIRCLYLRLSAEFAAEPFDAVLEKCRELTKKYHACFPFLHQIAYLYVNHFMLAPAPELGVSVLVEASALFLRVETESGDLSLAASAKQGRALCAILQNDPQSVLLAYENDSPLHMEADYLLASSYLMAGDAEKARSTAQFGMYQNLCALLNLFPLLFSMCGSMEQLEREYGTARRVCDLFSVSSMSPHLLLSIQLSAAKMYAAFGACDTAAAILSDCAVLAENAMFPLSLHGNDFFDAIDAILADTAALGVNPPRDEKIVRESLLAAIRDDPVYASLADNPVYRAALARLQVLASQPAKEIYHE